VTAARWLLLAFQLPKRPSHARVKTWRRLQQVGAVAARNAVYVLPNTDACREDFEWIRHEIVALGGEATVFEANAIGAGGTEDLVAAFRRTRNAEYAALQTEIARLTTAARRRTAAPERQRVGRSARALRARFNSIERADFFSATERQRTATALADLEQLTQNSARAAATPTTALRAADYRGKRWVTRPRPGVDRMASAWLIRRFIDPKATFTFADAPGEAEIPFDMYVGDFSHVGSLCTFEVLCDRFRIADPVVVRLGHIVHDLDMKVTRYAPPEAPAVDRMIQGLRSMHVDDLTLLEQGIAMFEALARSFNDTAAGAERRPSRRRTKKPR